MTAFTSDRATASSGPEWLRARRRAAFERFDGAELPTAESELWRYTPVADLDLERYQPAATDGPPPATEGVWSGVADAVPERCGTITIVDGRLAAVDLTDEATAAGLTVTTNPEAGVDFVDVPDPDALGALHDAFASEIVVVDVPAGAVIDRPLVVVQAAVTEGVASFPHLVIRSGANSELTVLDHWTSPDIEAYVGPVVEVQPGDGAHLRYVGVQYLNRRVWTTGHLLARPGRDATAKAWFLALGGLYARVYVSADLSAQGANADIAGVYFGEGGQTLDFRSLQDHRGSRSVSNFVLKGAVVEEAHGVYTGLIRVHEGAKATESFLANRNLVLDDGAHVDSVPNLEILNENDIRSCGHAAATGPVDEEHRFYLESRGVPTEVAERLIVFGFFDDVVSTIPVAGVREPLRQVVSRKLSHV